VTESVPVLRREAEARQALAELKGVANIIPNQAILINAIALREAKESSEIENIVTTQDRLYRALAASSSAAVDASTKEVMQYRSALRNGEALVRDHGFLSVNHIRDQNLGHASSPFGSSLRTRAPSRSFAA